MSAKCAITHKDSLGNEGRTEAGDVQVMSAGSGIRHAEYISNPRRRPCSRFGSCRPARADRPGWGRQALPEGDRSGRFITLASGFEADQDALPIRTDARVLGASLKQGESTDYTPDAKRHLYLVPASGAVEINGVRIGARDGAAITGEAGLKITALEDSELVLVDAA